MNEYITKEQVIAWFSPYGHTDEPIPFETLAADLRDCIPDSDVEPVRHGRWNDINSNERNPVTAWVCRCSLCGCPQDYKHNFCPHCGARMDLEGEP